MIEIIQKLYENLEDELSLIKENDADALIAHQKSILTAENAITSMKEWIKSYHFNNDEEEINFFRNDLPLFYSKLIYHLRLYYLETNKQGAGRKLYKKLIHDELKDINLFLKKQANFRQYYNSGNRLLDKELFTRSNLQLPFFTADCSFALDPDFCTTYSIILSQLLAFEKLQDYFLLELRKLNHFEIPIDMPDIKPKKWMLGSFALIELGYLLHLTGAVQGSLKETMSFLEKCFDTNLGNYSRTLQKMRIRQGERATFLAKGIESIYKHMDSLDNENL